MTIEQQQHHQEELKPLYFTPYNGPIEDTDYEFLHQWYPDCKPNDTPETRANRFLWYITHYFLNFVLPEEDKYPRGSRYEDFRIFNFGPLIEKKHPPAWKVELAWDTKEFGFPHMRVLMTSGPLSDHIVAPVLLFSVVGMNHIRIPEAFFDGKELVVRGTKKYNLEHRDLNLLFLLSRWWLGHPSTKETRGDVSNVKDPTNVLSL